MLAAPSAKWGCRGNKWMSECDVLCEPYDSAPVSDAR